MESGNGNSNVKSIWHWLSLSDEQLERADLVAMNLAVAREIPSLRELDIPHYCRIVDQWTQRFAESLPSREAVFHQTPWKWKDDIRFFRVGMLQGFLGHELGISYIEELKQSGGASYTEPSALFLNGVIDGKQGTCANMAALHVAISRRLGWPVSLACVKSHYISRFDDGNVVHNIEATSTHAGSFSSDSDEEYLRSFGLPRKAITSGSDLRRLSAREMIGTFLGMRARHFRDVGDVGRADRDYALARAFAPFHRASYISSVYPMLKWGERLFDRSELGRPSPRFDDSSIHSVYGSLSELSFGVGQGMDVVFVDYPAPPAQSGLPQMKMLRRPTI